MSERTTYRKTRTTALMAFAALAMALVAMSCASDRIGNDPGEVADDGEGYVSFAINLDYGLSAAGGTRATSVTGLDWGTPEENYVEKVRIVLVDLDYNNYNRAKYVFDFKIRTRTDSDPAEPGKVGFVEEGVDPGDEPHLYSSASKYHFVTFARKIARKPYIMLVLINPPGDPDNDDGNQNNLYARTNEGNNVESLVNSYSLSQAYYIEDVDLRDRSRYGIAEDNYFFMSNHQGPKYLYTIDMTATPEEANDNPVKIRVSRAVAKVTTDPSMPSVSPAGARIRDLKWELDVANRSSNWFRKPTAKITPEGQMGEMETDVDLPFDPIDETAILKHLKEIYAEDLNFQGYSRFSQGNVPEPGEWDFDYYFQTLETNFLMPYTLANRAPVLIRDLGETVYCLENTMDNFEQFSDVATNVALRCKYTPVSFNDDESYFVFSEYLIDVETMQSYVDDPANIPQELKDLELQKNIELAQAKGFLNSPLASLTGSFEQNGIKYFHEGVNYYRVLIEHADFGSLTRSARAQSRSTPAPPPQPIPLEPDEYFGRLGVVRNNHYKVKVTGIKGPGSPTMLGSNDRSLVCSVTIENWGERGSEIIIN